MAENQESVVDNAGSFNEVTRSYAGYNICAHRLVKNLVDYMRSEDRFHLFPLLLDWRARTGDVSTAILNEFPGAAIIATQENKDFAEKYAKNLAERGLIRSEQVAYSEDSPSQVSSELVSGKKVVVIIPGTPHLMPTNFLEGGTKLDGIVAQSIHHMGWRSENFGKSFIDGLNAAYEGLKDGAPIVYNTDSAHFILGGGAVSTYQHPAWGIFFDKVADAIQGLGGEEYRAFVSNVQGYVRRMRILSGDVSADGNLIQTTTMAGEAGQRFFGIKGYDQFAINHYETEQGFKEVLRSNFYHLFYDKQEEAERVAKAIDLGRIIDETVADPNFQRLREETVPLLEHVPIIVATKLLKRKEAEALKLEDIPFYRRDTKRKPYIMELLSGGSTRTY